MKDGYIDFFNEFKISSEDFIRYGLNAIVVADKKLVSENWNSLKGKIINNEEVFVRGYGRDALGTDLNLNFYEDLLNNNKIKKDPTNNSYPTKLIEELTGLKKGKKITNYQVSHVFGKTKNPYAFTAPWNIAFVPKIFDPFTGHESKGEITTSFTKAFQAKIYNEYEEFICEYNEIMNALKVNEIIDEFIIKNIMDEKKGLKFKKDILGEFDKINLT